MMDELLARVPAKLRPRFREIVAITDAVCDAHLDAEFRDLCRGLAAVACTEGLPVTSGKAAGWAAGVVAAVGYVNFLGDPSQPHHMTTDEMAKKIGVSPATLQNKSKAIRDALDIDRVDPRFSTRKMVDQNPMTWMLQLGNGLVVDLRNAPRGAQEAAFRRGLIPYIPADGPPGEGAKSPRKGKPAGKRATRGKAATGPVGVYTLDVSLMSGPITEQFAKKNKSVVRTIEIRGDQTLEDLHEAIFAAFDRDDAHMYEFQFGKRPMDPKGPRYVLPMAADDDFGPPIAGTVDTTTIDALGLKVGRHFGYWFDFGDDWHHQIDVVKIDDGPPSGEYPRVVKRVGESPPQYVDWDEEGG
jgi:hypothetical protein